MIYLIYLILFLIPAYLIRFKIFGIPTTLLELTIYVALFVQLILLFFKKTTLKKIPSKWLYPIALFIFSAVVSVFVSDNKLLSLGVLKGWIFDPLIVFFLIYNNLNYYKFFYYIIVVSVLSGFVLTLVGIIQYITGNFLTPDHRISSIFESANYLAMYLGPLIPLNLYLMLTAEKKWQKISWGVILLANLVVLFFTYSYAAWFALAISVLIGVIYLIKSKIKYIVIGFFLVLTGAFAYIQKDTPKFTQLFDFQNRSTLKARIEIWKVSWYMIKKHPIEGIGLGNFEKKYQENLGKVVWPPLDWSAPQPHNIFLAFWLNMGFLGLVSFIWIIGIFIKEEINSLKSQKYHIISFLLFISMMIILLHGLFDTPFWKNDLAIIFWIVVALEIYMHESFLRSCNENK